MAAHLDQGAHGIERDRRRSILSQSLARPCALRSRVMVERHQVIQ